VTNKQKVIPIIREFITLYQIADAVSIRQNADLSTICNLLFPLESKFILFLKVASTYWTFHKNLPLYVGGKPYQTREEKLPKINKNFSNTDK